MRRVLSKAGHNKAANEPRQYSYADTDDSKARHILGLDTTHLRPSRRNSVSSSSTNKLRSVTFSNATTAAASITDSSQSDRGAPSLSRKGSSPLLRRNKKSDIQTDALKPKGSSSSLRSFYDKSRTPLVVSQQTSESSRRDFALRKGAPVIVSTPTQETEHSRQVRLMTELSKTSSRTRSQLAPSVTKVSNPISISSVPSIHEAASDTAESLSSQPSASRISILRKRTSKTSLLSPSPKIKEEEEESPNPISDVNPARAKINVRRPKAGTKNWFDSLDTDSSEDEDQQREPHLTDDFALDMTSALNPGGQTNRRPVSSVPHNLAELPTEVPDTFYADRRNSQLLSDRGSSVALGGSMGNSLGKRKIGVFDNADLSSQSILDLESSDDEEEENKAFQGEAEELNRVSRSGPSFRANPRPIAHIEIAGLQPINTGVTGKTAQETPKEHFVKQPVPRRVSSRMITYLDDCSTETVTQQEDLLTSFPQTPTDTPSRSSSLREYTVSEDEGSINTKVMTVTRQEESLIAAMRLKKTAMKRAQAIAHRQSALTILERNSTSSPSRRYSSGYRDNVSGMSKSQSPTMPTRTRVPIASTQHSQRTDSVTTIQTDSMRQPSIRSSIATYLSEGSEDLQLPYSSTDGLPIGSSYPRHASSTTSDRPLSHRDTFLSELSMSTYNASPSERSPSVRDSHLIELDPINHRLLREEIPSQLFLERPFLGWEAQANMQRAH